VADFIAILLHQPEKFFILSLFFNGLVCVFSAVNTSVHNPPATAATNDPAAIFSKRSGQDGLSFSFMLNKFLSKLYCLSKAVLK
jgi:hypothetical protein